MGEFLWTTFWLVLGFIGIVLSWPWWLIVVLLALGGVIYIDIDDIDIWY